MKTSKIELAAIEQTEAARHFPRFHVVGSRPEDFKAFHATLDKIHALALEIQRKRRGF